MKPNGSFMTQSAVSPPAKPNGTPANTIQGLTRLDSSKTSAMKMATAEIAITIDMFRKPSCWR